MANKLKVIAEIIPGGEGFYVVNSDNVGVGNQSLTTAIAAGTTETGKKADKTYVDTELAKKANAAETTAALNSKADAATVTALETTVSDKADSSTVSSLQTQVNANTTKTVDLQSQIDTLVVEAGGDSNPEVVQARTDENGVAHTTLKDRIDSSFTDAKSDLSDLKDYTDSKIAPINNLPDEFNKVELPIENGTRYIIVPSTIGYVPTKSSSQSYMSSAKIDVTTGEKYRFNTYCSTASLAYIGFADSDGKILSYDKYVESQQKIINYDFEIPNNVSVLYLNGNSTMVLQKVSKGDIATQNYVKDYSIRKGNDSLLGQDNSAVWNNNMSVVDAMKTYANSIIYDKDMIDFRVPLSEHFSHTSYIKIVNNLAFITMMRNDVSTADYSEDINTYVTLTIFNINTSTVVKDIKVCGYNSVVGSHNVISGCAGLTILSLTSEKCVLQASVKLADNKWHTIVYVYDIATETLSSAQECKIVVGENKYNFTTENFSQYVFELSDTDIGVGCVMTHSETEHYGMFMCGDKLPSGVVMTTTNFIDYTYAFTPNVEVNGKWECDIFYSGGYLYYAMRESEKVYATLAKIDATNYNTVDTLRISDCGSRLSFYENNGVLYLIHSICNRNRTEIIEINKRYLSNSGIISQPTLSCVYPSVDAYGDWFYITSTNNSSTRVYIRRFRKTVLSNLEVTNKMLMLLTSENE